ncbi:MAG: helix-turn-helix domain-containing protein [Candidatus Accumulibacter sp.]|nr:helix-turn-helix domain-containing protein [Accumulibacter sp.]
MSKKEIGKRIQRIRADSGLNQRDFAARLDISNGGISQIESGKAMPGGDFLLRIHQEFGIDVTWLLTGVSVGGVVPVPALKPDESALLDNYRHSPEEQQRLLRETSVAFAQHKGKRSA